MILPWCVPESFRLGILHTYILNRKEAGNVARVVVLDVDGTLMDTNYLHTEAWAQAFEEAGLQIPPRVEIHKQIGKGSNLLVGEFVEDEDAAEKVTALHGEIYGGMQQHGYPLPGAKELLESLSERGYEVWFVTSAEDEELELHKERLEPEGKIAGIVNSSQVENSKPAPDIFEEALRRAGAKPEDTVSVGDAVWDVEAAKAAGIKTIGVLSGGAYSAEELKRAGAEEVYENCAALLDTNFPEDS
jgi:HAD superfamily hydrolase (TIGR01509 family)